MESKENIEDIQHKNNEIPASRDSEFKHTGIFGPGGFLSKLQTSTSDCEKDSLTFSRPASLTEKNDVERCVKKENDGEENDCKSKEGTGSLMSPKEPQAGSSHQGIFRTLSFKLRNVFNETVSLSKVFQRKNLNASEDAELQGHERIDRCGPRYEIKPTCDEKEKLKDKKPKQFERPADVSPFQIAVNMQHISEQIFGYLGWLDLIQCRLVSHQFKHYATAQLQKRKPVHFYKSGKTFITENGKQLEEFTQFSQTSTMFVGPVSSTEFIFEGRNLRNKKLQHFLDVHGKHLTKLSIICPHHSDYTIKQESEADVMKLVKKLLCKQAPNLEHLKLDIWPLVLWKNRSDGIRGFRESMRETDPEFIRINSRPYMRKVRANENLKVFNYATSTSSKVFEVVMRMSPHLEEVIMIGDNYQFLMEPKPLMFPKIIFRDHEYRVKVQPVATNAIASAASVRTDFDYNAKSLHSYYWKQRSLAPRFRWPQPMPNATSVHLTSGLTSGDLQRMFPKGHHLNKTFPSLRFIRLDVHGNRNGFINFANSFQFDPVLSIMGVQIFCANYTGEMICENDIEPLYKLFPNAVIKVNTLHEHCKL